MNVSLFALGAMRDLLLLLSLRALPFAGYACFSRRVALRGKVAALVAYAALVIPLGIFGRLSLVGVTIAGVAFYVLVSCLVHRLAAMHAGGRITRGAVFVANGVGYLLVPSLLLPGLARSTFLVFGLDLALSGYSYCVDTARRPSRPSLGECLFFLVVNPALVYSSRGERVADAGWNPSAALRVATGVLCLYASSAVLRPAAALFASVGAVPAADGHALARLAALGVLGFLTQYAAHSGLASVQIGLMRQTGYRVPERYNYPFLADGPLDFWRRWNIYLGTWLWLYVFAPVSRRSLRWRRGMGAAAVLPLLLTFLASGALHDGYGYLKAFSGNLKFTAFFLSVFAIVIVWSSTAKGFQTLRARLRSNGRAVVDALAVVAPRLALAALVVLCASVWAT